MKEDNLISLIELEEKQSATIVNITNCDKSAKRLCDLGLTPNTPITVIRKNFSHGPIEIRMRGSNLILGKGVASKVLVRLDEK